MKKFMLVSCLIFAVSFAFGQGSSKSSVKSPDIYFVESFADFGTITENDNPELTFTFYNSGNAPLLIKNVKPACGCTTPEWPREPIMPGKSGTIKATFTGKGYAGQNVHKSITVTTNVPENGNDKVLVLYIKGFVKK